VTKTDQYKGRVAWRSPSNLAIVKYWGKYGNQYPRNASLSLTLNNAYTETSIGYIPKKEDGISLAFKFEGKTNAKFAERINLFLHSIQSYFPFLVEYHLDIESVNSFPHSSGIASSASSMSALALCLCSMEKALTGGLSDKAAFLKKASLISRLGSGSASRSVYPAASVWGEHPKIAHSSQDYAIPFDEGIHDVFKTFHDDILIVSGDEKSVSSSAGHALMEDNIYAISRYKQAQSRLADLVKIMKSGDVDAFGRIAEDEALTLHALMMCSNPSYMLIEEGSISIIREVRAYRSATKIPVYFSLDAGPNIHLLYPDEHKEEVKQWIESNLRQYCHKGKIIQDHVGNGPIQI
jgi:diphosphomevalonate decarboxylase